MEPTSDPAPVPSRQEMFDRAWRGLKAQGWRRAVNLAPDRPYCQYLTDDGRRCAWGHVDPEGTTYADGTVSSLHTQDIGLAARLTQEDLVFAQGLQQAHDKCGDDGDRLEFAMRDFAGLHGLTIPEED